MAEYREVYTREGVATGVIRDKKAKSNPGDYFLHSIIIMRTADGQYVLQQRSKKARHYPGKWDVTGGGVKAGESPEQAACREACEEVGINANPDELKEIYRYTTTWDDGSGLLLFVFGCIVDAPRGEFNLNRYEVEDAKLVSFDEFLSAIAFNKEQAFLDAVSRFEAECQNK